MMWNNLRLVLQTTILLWVSSVTDESSHFMASNCRPNTHNSKAKASFFHLNSAVNNLMKILYLCFKQVLSEKNWSRQGFKCHVSLNRKLHIHFDICSDILIYFRFTSWQICFVRFKCIYLRINFLNLVGVKFKNKSVNF